MKAALNKAAPDFNARRALSASLLRLRAQAPFFATLALFAKMELREDLPTAATDGRDVFFNPQFLAMLTPNQTDGLLLHEVLHAALLHIPRRGTRDPWLWNIAADIVINGIISNESPFELPPRALRDRSLEKKGVEEVYELLQKQVAQWQQCDVHLDLMPSSGDDVLSSERRAILETYWNHARHQATMMARLAGQQPAGLGREIGALAAAKLDWRAHLWRFLVRTPVDFSGFDRRFIGQDLYLENLEGESVQVWVGVDTSGSIGDAEMTEFLSEVQGIVRAYPQVRCALYYCDAEAHGPFPVTAQDELPRPVGGGGTDFRPFFRAIEKENHLTANGVAVYLTDGYGQFPATPLEMPVLWVVTPGGLDDNKFPFGETARLWRGETSFCLALHL